MHKNIEDPDSKGVFIVDRRFKAPHETVDQIIDILWKFTQLDRRTRIEVLDAAVAAYYYVCEWTCFFFFFWLALTVSSFFSSLLLFFSLVFFSCVTTPNVCQKCWVGITWAKPIQRPGTLPCWESMALCLSCQATTSDVRTKEEEKEEKGRKQKVRTTQKGQRSDFKQASKQARRNENKGWRQKEPNLVWNRRMVNKLNVSNPDLIFFLRGGLLILGKALTFVRRPPSALFFKFWKKANIRQWMRQGHLWQPKSQTPCTRAWQGHWSFFLLPRVPQCCI